MLNISTVNNLDQLICVDPKGSGFFRIRVLPTTELFASTETE